MAKKSQSEKVEHEGNSTRDELTNSLADVVNKSMKDQGKVAFFLDEEDDPSQITDWISTGNDLLDLAISNRPNGGLPVGRIVELSGLEASGKSLIAAHALASTQKKGGVAVFIDTETAVSKEFLNAIGVNTKEMLYLNLDTVEDIFDSLETIVAQVRKVDKERLVTIVVDSVAAASTKTEMEKDHGADGYATQKAIALSKAMRKITVTMGKQRVLILFTNQLRQKMGFVGFGDPWTTSGGKAIAFHSSVRIRLKSVGQIKDASKEVVGIQTKAVIVKNRMGPPFRSATFNVLFDRGIDNYGNWIEFLIDNKIIRPLTKTDLKTEKVEKKKSKKELEAEMEAAKKEKSLCFDFVPDATAPDTTELVKFEKKDFINLITTRPELREFLYGKICETFVMKYKDPDASLADELEVSQEGDGMEE
jgi:recombination protein RecA